MKQVCCYFSYLLFTITIGFSADSAYVKKITDTLASRTFLGRGYVANGMKLAGNFIAGEMKQNGLTVQRQAFKYPVNTFPGKVSLALDGAELRPGIDFVCQASSKSCKGSGVLQQRDSVTWINQRENVMIRLVDKLTWSVSTSQAGYTAFDVLKTVVKSPGSFSCVVNATALPAFSCENIIGTIKGSSRPDSVIMFMAHYDHLGAMGNAAYFPGANDNAGGVAMMLDLAKYYISNPPRYTVQFIAFAGEEAGLIGSKYYVDHPLFELGNIRFLVNLDLMGNGEDGITVVNATEFPHEFALLQEVNESNKLLVAVNSRGKAHNSDHYWFTEKGVPSFFIYTLGKRKAYHDVQDVAETLFFYEVNDLEQLIIQFIDRLISGNHQRM